MKGKRKGFSLRARGRSFAYAFRGLRFAVVTQHNLWIDIFVITIVTGLGLWLKLAPFEWAIIVATVVIVFSMEVLNTAIEALIDLVSPERSAKAALVKDLAAAAVLLSAIASIVIGLLILGPPLLDKLNAMF